MDGRDDRARDQKTNVYIDTSAYKASRYPRELVDYMRGHGKKKVLFGSNFPMNTPRSASRGSATSASPKTRAPFLGGNAVRVFGID
jgi:uncharacterized protein